MLYGKIFFKKYVLLFYVIFVERRMTAWHNN